MLNSGKKIRAWRDNKKKNILPLRKKNSERKKKTPLQVKWSVP